MPVPIPLAQAEPAQPTATQQSEAGQDSKTNNDNATELAKKLQNPIANLISVPIQNNWDYGIGSTNAMRYLVNVQPVIPFSISQDWNLITRTIIPIIHAESPVPGGSDAGGLSDIVQSFFFSPKAPVGGSWAVGLCFFIPPHPMTGWVHKSGAPGRRRYC